MPHTIQTTVYYFNELPTDAAKEKALSWGRENEPSTDWDREILEEYQNEILPKLGFEDAKIQYSGFWSQGDGASFTCNVNIVKYCEANNVPLRPRVKSLVESGKIDVSGNIFRHSNRYSHENTVVADFDAYKIIHPNIGRYMDEICNTVIGRAREVMREIYRRLEIEYDQLTSDEYIAELLTLNEYTFTESGERFG